MERQSQEIWRAAAADDDAVLEKSLAAKVFEFAATVAAHSRDPISAMEQFDEKLEAARTSSLFTEVGKRALCRAIVAESGTAGFVGELFAETAAYYVSRDLPSAIGAPGYVRSISEAMNLKSALCDIARQRATEHVASATRSISRSDLATEWSSLVRRILLSLQGAAQ